MINTNLAGHLGGVGRFDEAEARYRKVMEIDPLMAFSYSGVADIEAYVRNNFAEALRYQRKAVELDQDGWVNTLGLALLLWDLGAGDELASLVATARTRWRDRDAVSYMVETVASVAAGNKQAAAVLALKSCDLDPNCFALPLIVAAEVEAGRFEQARGRIENLHPVLFERTPRVTTANYGTAVLLAFVFQNTGKRDAAARLLEGSECAIQGLPRLGERYEILDVAIHALRGCCRRSRASTGIPASS